MTPSCAGQMGNLHCDCYRLPQPKQAACSVARYQRMWAETLAGMKSDAERRQTLETLSIKSKPFADVVRAKAWELMQQGRQGDLLAAA
jgi:phage-related baseplate assembly protein